MKQLLKPLVCVCGNTGDYRERVGLVKLANQSNHFFPRIDAAQFRQLFVAIFNPRQFEELETYLKGRRRPAKASKSAPSLAFEPPPWNVKKMLPFQIKEIVADWKREIDRVKDNIRFGKGAEKDKYQVQKLQNWIKSFEAVLYGRE